MSRRKKQATSQPVSNARRLHEQWINRLVGLPRIGRVGLAILFTLAVTLALSPIVDSIYLRYLYTPETALAPALVSVAFGLAMYLVGWQVFVGLPGEPPPARLLILWYVGVGVLALLLVVLWLITGVASGSAPTV